MQRQKALTLAYEPPSLPSAMTAATAAAGASLAKHAPISSSSSATAATSSSASSSPSVATASPLVVPAGFVRHTVQLQTRHNSDDERIGGVVARLWKSLTFASCLLIDKVLLVAIFVAGTYHTDLFACVYLLCSVGMLFQGEEPDKWQWQWRALRHYNIFVLAMLVAYETPYIELQHLGHDMLPYQIKWPTVLGLKKYGDAESALTPSAVLGFLVFVFIDLQRLITATDAYKGVYAYYEAFARTAYCIARNEMLLERRSKLDRVADVLAKRRAVHEKYSGVLRRIAALGTALQQTGSGDNDGDGNDNNTVLPLASSTLLASPTSSTSTSGLQVTIPSNDDAAAGGDANGGDVDDDGDTAAVFPDDCVWSTEPPDVFVDDDDDDADADVDDETAANGEPAHGSRYGHGSRRPRGVVSIEVPPKILYGPYLYRVSSDSTTTTTSTTPALVVSPVLSLLLTYDRLRLRSGEVLLYHANNASGRWCE
jgi:hypothetical protein